MRRSNALGLNEVLILKHNDTGRHDVQLAVVAALFLHKLGFVSI